MDELGDALRVKGFNPTWKELITLGKELDVNKNGQIGTQRASWHRNTIDSMRTDSSTCTEANFLFN